ncbi:regulator of G-protein signaling 7 isoform X5 [Spodoptera frugiperda]|uniref:Regulator of G-protein signaling 7 isoform X1 n=1 Tax=Spodoptera frugiperda TaxID=7108 RepID=A0A9R0DZN3_SPOFR|nr:regulator of G-protein signaling 7 isoform X1 [Spodoptera frugiperda]XP_050556466.1 regulator of G-protein signaling 7 isoform X2 [Spodoptera frugiperda]XP_050556467.1 regulator of G-protein signaling 7 isoform X3 [Spodoptera frugiperda]XP_050556468.1 regulator of G-protein signaling 7 isoform X4 [Spodoptera frugiperda]XP_050556469.1 regulator of G-protein signaling 7 isoform X5 [Spodoptera frugiperda]
MVTMNSSEKAASKACQQGPSRDNSKCIKEEKEKDRDKKDNSALPPGVQALMSTIPSPEESPNYLVYKKMEAIIEKMQDENTGVPVKTVKSFMTKIPSVFTGTDLVAWLARHLNLDETWEALHVAHLLAAHGYLFPIDDHCLTVKNDNTYYRFQTPYFWPSNQWEPENTDYAVYLCKRTMQNKARLELADYEAESLARLQKMFSRKWEFIFMQAEAQSKVDKKRDKLERKVLDSQERAFWDVHRPMPGCVNTTEIDPKKLSRINALKAKRLRQCQELILQHNLKNNPIVTITNPQESEEEIQKKNDNVIKENGESSQPPIPAVTVGEVSPQPASVEQQIEAARRQVSMLRTRLERRNVRVSKVADMFIAYCEQYAEYDAFLTPPEWPNPWVSDTTDMWDQEKQCKEPLPLRRVRRWSFSLRELLQDNAGKEHFAKFLSKEFSGENLKFWLAVQELKALPIRRVAARAKDIWKEYLAADAPSPINIDAASRELTRQKVESGTADRYCFDQAQAHVYHLMKSDSYSRYLRSEMYKDYLNGSKKKTSVKGIRSIVSFTARKETSAN